MQQRFWPDKMTNVVFLKGDDPILSVTSTTSASSPYFFSFFFFFFLKKKKTQIFVPVEA